MNFDCTVFTLGMVFGNTPSQGLPTSEMAQASIFDLQLRKMKLGKHFRTASYPHTAPRNVSKTL